MNIKKRESEKKDGGNKRTDFLEPRTQAVIQMMVGLTEEVNTGDGSIFVRTNGNYPPLVMRKTPDSTERSPHYRLTEAMAVRDALILLGNVEQNTTWRRLNQNDWLDDLYMSLRYPVSKFKKLKEVVGAHMDRLGVELSLEEGGVVVREIPRDFEFCGDDIG